MEKGEFSPNLASNLPPKLLGYRSPCRKRNPKRSSALTRVAELEELVHICTAHEKTPHQSHESTQPRGSPV
jgi:hypothetical protein